MSFIHELSVWLRATLLPYGGYGLMLLAMCDSSFVSLPEVNDLLLMTFAIDNPSSWTKLAALTTLGSIMGCSMLYFVGRKGGESLLRRRFSEDRILRIRSWYLKYGVLAVIVPSLLPPPTPFKVFVLAAGAFGISWPRFLIAVAVGRGIRYFSEGFLAVTYGTDAIKFVQQNYGKIGIGLSALIVATVLVYLFARRRRMGSIEV
jgi:membrane protein YqaA with SNARE-associated domain